MILPSNDSHIMYVCSIIIFIKRRKIHENHIKVKVDGKKFDNVRAAAKFYGIHEHTARTRIGRGWSIEKALKTKKVDLAKKIKFNGKTFGSIRKLAKF